jgi:hypothetical protein
MNDDDDRDDETIYADSVGGAQGVESPLDELAERSVDVVLGLVRRANALAGGVLMFAVVACVGGFLLGLAAFGDDGRRVWVVVGGGLAAWAIGAVLLAMWRLRAIRKGAGLLTGEVRSLMSGDSDSERHVVETMRVTEDSTEIGVVQVTRQYSSLGDLVRGQSDEHPQLALTLASITSFPAKMLLATAIGFGFLAMSFVFVLMLLF